MLNRRELLGELLVRLFFLGDLLSAIHGVQHLILLRLRKLEFF